MDKPKCSINGCDNDSAARGWCHKHYRRWYLHGNPSHSLVMREQGTGHITKGGYMYIFYNGEHIFQHIVIVEKILGKKLPEGAVIHHINCNGLDNRNENLVVCQNQAYHNLLHTRMRAVCAGFPPYFLKCQHCKNFDDPKNMTSYPHGKNKHHVFHSSCGNEYKRNNRKLKKEGKHNAAI